MCSKFKFIFFLLLLPAIVLAQQDVSVARSWNEVLLASIRNDYARPTVHARNLFHVSAGMYDAWAVHDPKAEPYFLNKTRGQYYFFFEEGYTWSEAIEVAQETAMSYVAYRLISHRFRYSPGATEVKQLADDLMLELGHDIYLISQDYLNEGPAALGNYLAEQIILYGLQDGSNENQDYQNLFYSPVNDPLILSQRDSSISLNDPNRWQPLGFDQFIDQSGNLIVGSPSFLGAEWGSVIPFALKNSSIAERDGFEYSIYHDPGAPSLLVPGDVQGSVDYKWNFSLVASWSSHLDIVDSILIDISPNTLGNLDLADFPKNREEVKEFYDFFNGGDGSEGYVLNPITDQSYDVQIVPRGDYTRVLSEFWADGPESETPPGHWFKIMNDVMDHPLFDRKLEGEGAPLTALEWDAKAYFILGGAMHDAAIAAWSIKGYYDFIRPISALRYMASLGQSSLPEGINYHVDGMPLVEGLIAQVEAGDALVGLNGENIGAIKLYSWKGHDEIQEVTQDVAGVGWVLAKNWWPYQRPSFVTPPFAGYISGHSTYSRAAATVLTLLTGDPYFPGGMGAYLAKKDEFLKFERGPSQDITLQWAKYIDAADQCGLSRIYGGIHPPMDDLPGRLIGAQVGEAAYALSTSLFNSEELLNLSKGENFKIHPNPVSEGNVFKVISDRPVVQLQITDLMGSVIIDRPIEHQKAATYIFKMASLSRGSYVVSLIDEKGEYRSKLLQVH